jgi:hypothetical protein
MKPHMVRFPAFLVLTLVPLLLHAQAQTPAGGFTRMPDRMWLIEARQDAASCRMATASEAHAMRRGSAPVHVIYPAPGQVGVRSGLSITLRSTSQLDGFPAAKAAFVNAAKVWESKIATPLSVTIDVDYGPTLFGTPYPRPEILGATGDAAYNGPYTQIRPFLVSSSDSATETSLYNSLPGSSVPTDLGSAANVAAAYIHLRALGVVGLPDDAPAIGFNSAYGFDLDPSNGINPSQFDFEAVAVHEMGHALGFGSAVGATEPMDSGTVSEVVPTLWDLFRFRPGVTNGTFSSAQRPMSSGGTHVSFVYGTAIQMSTGRPDGTGGDEQQSSHWKDNTFGNPLIGLMDPTIVQGARGTLTDADLAAFDLMGYDVVTGSAPGGAPAAPSNLSAAATSSSVIRLTWTDNSNNESEFRVEQRNQSGSFVDLGAAGANATSIDVTNFSAGQTGTFRIRARNAAGDSAYSNEASATTPGGSSACTPSSTVVCLLSNRFRIAIDYVNPFANPPQPGNFVGAKLVAGVQNPDVATFGISSPQAIEVVVRIQDARPFGINRFDIYYGGLTDLPYNVRVTDTQTGVSRTYTNAAGTVGGGVDRTSFGALLSGDDRLTSGGADSFVIGTPELVTATSRMPLTKGEAKTLLADVRDALAATANAGSGGACSELEPNQFASDATILTLGQPCTGAANVADVGSGILFDDDLIEDLYKVTISATATLNVTMSFTNAGADLDLFLLRQVGGSTYEVLDASNGFSQTEAISLLVPGGTYYVGVSAFAGGSNYTVTASSSGGNPSGCTASDTVACLLDNRFRVSIDYVNAFANPPQPGSFRGAKLVAGSQNPDVATFGISSAQAIEVVVRVQDTRPFGLNRFDIYYGGLTDLEYTVTVTDTQNGTTRTYRNAPGTVGGGVDRSSFTAN